MSGVSGEFVSPTQADIDLDEVGSLSAGNHDDIAYEAGFLTEDEYEAAGMPSWWLEATDD